MVCCERTSNVGRTVGLLFLLYNEEVILLIALPRVFQFYYFDKHKGISTVMFEYVKLHVMVFTFNNKNIPTIEMYL